MNRFMNLYNRVFRLLNVSFLLLKSEVTDTFHRFLLLYIKYWTFYSSLIDSFPYPSSSKICFPKVQFTWYLVSCIDVEL